MSGVRKCRAFANVACLLVNAALFCFVRNCRMFANVAAFFSILLLASIKR
ncbi:unnamed protein product [Meloidogyne enterolobii]|uniref:Uncharacterized protein n=1 Tax=Meloidogyne enterolobii TaxID=390850 RepID=A0ACB1AB79_MELEN